MRVLSYSGGVQSTALLVLAANRAIAIDCAIFVDLGAAESPDTLRYVYTVAIPFARKSGISIQVAYYDALGDLLANPKHPKPPFRAKDGGFSTRQCTNHWKIRPFRKTLRRLMRERGLRLGKDIPSVVLGISADEATRMATPSVRYYVHEYPLVELGVTRDKCLRIIADSSLPLPDKSACWFCPYAPASRYRRIVNQHADVAGLAALLNDSVSKARRRAGLPELVVTPEQLVTEDEDMPCGGHCMT